MNKKLKDIASIKNGHSFRGKIEDLESGNVSVVQISNMNELEGINYGSLIKTDFAKIDKKPDLLLKEGDILCVNKGPRIYSICLRDVPPNVIAYSHISVIRLNEKSDICPEYVSWAINNAKRFYHRLSQSSSGVNHVPISQLGELEIDLIPIEKQIQISEIEALKNEEKSLTKKLLLNRSKLVLGLQRKLASS